MLLKGLIQFSKCLWPQKGLEGAAQILPVDQSGIPVIEEGEEGDCRRSRRRWVGTETKTEGRELLGREAPCLSSSQHWQRSNPLSNSGSWDPAWVSGPCPTGDRRG